MRTATRSQQQRAGVEGSDVWTAPSVERCRIEEDGGGSQVLLGAGGAVAVARVLTHVGLPSAINCPYN